MLPINRDYFRLRKPLEWQMYELARKHCGSQQEWLISLESLRKKCGSVSTNSEFRRLVVVICEEDKLYNHIPDYAVSVDGENVRFSNRQLAKAPALAKETHCFPILDAKIYHDARTVAPGYDVYYLEQQWR